jgi:uncharacterized Zn finger protein
MSYWRFPRSKSVAEKKADAAAKLKQLKKTMPNIKPVVIEGKALAKTWWGKSWNNNLERYADYENRIERGRSYVRHGAVLDLQISPGKVRALVQGSDTEPYEVLIGIKDIPKTHWKKIQQQCKGQLKSLQDLLAGTFPQPLADIFFNQKNGLFPGPKSISFDCSCPDWASMCKHVAAVLYGIGARFDEDPSLFFKLRGVNTEDLISRAVADTADNLLAKTKKKSAKVIDDADLSNIFGINMDLQPEFGKKAIPAPPAKTAGTKKRTAADTVVAAVNSPKGRKKASPQGTATAHVAELIAAGTTGINIEKLAEKTGYTKTKLYAIVHQLKKQGKITNKSHGVYVKG